LKIINEWHIATATNGNEINVQIIPLKRQQSTLNGFKWVEVGKKSFYNLVKKLNLILMVEVFIHHQTSCID
jgi:hypothetical protein